MNRISLIVLLLVMCLTSCVVKYRTHSTVLDYLPYTANGFFLTESNSVNFEYLPLGSVESSAYSGIDRYAQPEDALREFVDKCISMRANGAINMKVVVVYDTNNIKGYRVSGMAIKTSGQPLVE